MESKSNNTQACRETGKVEAPIDGKLSMVVIVQSHRASAGMRASCFSSAFRCWCFVTEGRVVDDDDDDDEIRAWRRILDEGGTCLHWWVSGSCQSNKRC